ncbi:hypothetical protein EVA_15504, partial [gut metagenome]
VLDFVKVPIYNYNELKPLY